MCGREGFRTCIIKMLRNRAVEGKLVCSKWLILIEIVALKEVLKCAKFTEIKGIKITCLKLGEHKDVKSVRPNSCCRLLEKV